MQKGTRFRRWSLSKCPVFVARLSGACGKIFPFRRTVRDFYRCVLRRLARRGPQSFPVDFVYPVSFEYLGHL